MIESLPQIHQITLIGLFLHSKQNSNFENQEIMEEVKFSNLMSGCNKLCEEIFWTKMDTFGFIDILTNLQNYDLIILKNFKKNKSVSNFNIGDRLSIVQKIHCDDIKYALSKNELFSKYFV